jgi:fructokinase
VSESRFLVAGESLVDIVIPPGGAPEQSPGGSPLNVAVGLSRLGLETLLATEVGDDDHGRLVQEHLRASGVRLTDGSVVEGLPTSTATARLDANGAAEYDFDLRWTMAPQQLPSGTTALHIGSIGAALAPGRDSVMDLVRQAAAQGLLITFDPNSRPALVPDAKRAWLGVRVAAASASVVKMSDEDLAFLRPDASAVEVAHDLLEGGTELVVVTFGAGGATAFSDAAVVEVRSGEVDVVDTVGAGDSYMAALVAVVAEHGLKDLDVARLEGYLTAAHQAAAITVSRRGADPPRRDELPPGWPGL